MSISGSLEDVSVADVMQFIHLGRRTGTLLLTRTGEEAMIGFHTGRLVSARGPETPKLGDLLVQAGVIDRATLDAAVETQSDPEDSRSIGQILIAEGKVDEDGLRQVVSQQIEQTISELVGWDLGTFEFVVDDLRPVDDIAVAPGDVVPDTDINTQMVLLEAARIFDERNRDGGAVEDLGAPSAAGGLGGIDSEDSFRELDALQVQPPQRSDDGLTPHVLHLASPDHDFAEELRAQMPPAIDRVEITSLFDAGSAPPNALAPIVLVDLREGRATLDDISLLHDRRPTTPVIALVDRVVPVSQVYGAGALAALPAEVDAVIACVLNVIRSQQQLTQLQAAAARGPSAGPSPDHPEGDNKAGVARLRRVFGDLRSGLLSATVALNLMHIISESVERAVLFLVRTDCLQALGAFGLGTDGRSLAELTRGLRLPLEEDNVLIQTLDGREAMSVKYDEATLPRQLESVLGAPLTGQVVVFPVLGAQRVISVIYTDNGDIDRPIEDIDILELATAQVGMAFENELLRRQIQQGG